MSTTPETLVIRYLMGDLPADERADIERRFFAEPDFLNLVRAIEEQLICDALAGDVEPSQQARFQDYFLSFPDLRRKYEATKALRHALAPGEVTPTPGLVSIGGRAKLDSTKKGSYPRGLAIAACVAGLFLLDDVRLRFGHAGGEPTILKTAIEPGPIRSSASQQVRLRVAPDTVLVRITLKVELSDRHNSYQAVLSQVDSGQEILRSNGLVARPEGAFRDVLVELPASILSENDYVLTLNGASPGGFEPVETYSFEVVRPSE